MFTAFLAFDAFFSCVKNTQNLYGSPRRGVAQPGSAPVLGTGGRKFESCLPDQLFARKSIKGQITRV